MNFFRSTAVFTFLLAIFASPATANNNVEQVAILDLEGYASRVFIHGNRLYVSSTAESGSLQIINITDPKQPFREGSIATADPPQSVIFQGDILYLATEGRFRVYNLAGEEPQRIGMRDINTRWSNIGIIVDDNMAFLLEGVSHNIWDPCLVKRLNIANLNNIGQVERGLNWQIGEFNTEFLDWVKVGDEIYALTDAPGRRIDDNLVQPGFQGWVRLALDGANAPRVIGAFETDHPPCAIATRDNFIFTGSGIYDIEDPDNPERISHEIREPLRMVLQGNFLYSAYESSFDITYVADPSRARSVGIYGDEDGICSDLVVQGEFIFTAAGEEGIKVHRYPNNRQSISITTRNHNFGTLAVGQSATRTISIYNDGFGPLEIERIWLTQGELSLDNEGDFVIPAGERRQISVTFHTIEQVDDMRDTLWIESNDIDGPKRITFRGSSSTVMSRGALQIANGYGADYVVVDGIGYALAGGLTSFSFDNPDELSIIGRLDINAQTFLDYENGLLYTLGYGVLNVIDIADPADMRLVGSLEHWEIPNAEGIAVVGNRAILARRTVNPGAVVIDVEDPENMRVIDWIDNESIDGIASAGNLLFTFNNVMKIWDFTNQDEPELLSTLQNPHENCRWGGITFGGDYAYIASYVNDAIARYDIVDLSDVENPEIVGEFDAPDRISQTTFSGRHLISASSSAFTFTFFDMIDPLHPEPICTHQPPNGETILQPLGDGLFLGGRGGYFRVFDLNAAVGIFGEEPGQRIDLNRGWNLISLNVFPDQRYWRNDRGPSVPLMARQWNTFANFSQMVLIKDSRGNFHDPIRGFNNIPYWNSNEAYWVRMAGHSSGAWDGAKIEPQTEILLRRGFNLMPYLPDYELDMSAPDFEAISPIRDHVVLLKDGAGNFAIPALNFSSIDRLSPGKGYSVKVDQDLTFSYPVDQGERFASLPAPGIRQPLNTGNTMSVLFKITNAGLAPSSAVIKAFSSDGSWVGSGRIDATGNAGVPVFGDDPTTAEVDGAKEGEMVSFRLWNGQSKVELSPVWETGHGSYTTDGFVMGSLNLGEKDVLPAGVALLSAFPNPFNSTTTITFTVGQASLPAKLAIYGINGRLVADLLGSTGVSAGQGIHPAAEGGATANKVVWDATSVGAGVYFVRLEAGEEVRTEKIVLMR